MSRDTSANETVLKLEHDLRGPIVNLRGFSSEIKQSIELLRKLTENFTGQLPADFLIELNTLLNDDLQPCADYIDYAVGKLEQPVVAVVDYLRLCNKNSSDDAKD